MSKAIRIREHLYDEVARLATENRRPLIRQLEMLLEQALALTEREGGGNKRDPGTAASVQPSRSASADPHFKPDPKR